MQKHAPEAWTSRREDKKTLDLYGTTRKRTDDFGRKCLLARRMVERGVRFIQVYSGGRNNDDNWDAHGDLVKNHTQHAGETDKPVAGLLKDLKARGLLDSARRLGRRVRQAAEQPSTRLAPAATTTPEGSRCGSRAAASRAAPASARPTTSQRRVEDRYHVKNLHATILNQMGLDPNKLFVLLRRPRPEARPVVERRGADQADHLSSCCAGHTEGGC